MGKEKCSLPIFMYGLNFHPCSSVLYRTPTNNVNQYGNNCQYQQGMYEAACRIYKEPQ